MDAGYQVQTDYLRQQLAALHNGPRSRWRQHRLLEVVCRECGDTVLEVMNTKPYRVVRYWEHLVTKGEQPPAPWWGKGWSASEVQQAAYERAKTDTSTPLTRRGDSMFHPIPADWEGDSDELLLTACRCRGHELRGNMVADWLRSTRRKRLI